jgi:thiamine pyrophosphokinase
MRVLGLFLLLASSLFADVVILKSGAKVSGRVVEKPEHYEVTADGALRTYLKEEVERVVTSPKEFLGDSDKLFEEARADYKKALDLASSPAEQNVVLKAAIAKVARARESYSAAMDLFPDDGNLGKQIMLLMQLMRLLRERVHLDESRGPSAPGSSSKPAPPTVTLAADDALATLLDPAKRNDPARRAAAIVSFRGQRTDLAAAATLFLSRTDAEMKLEGATLKSVQEYFDKPWLKDPGKLTPELHLQAAQHLSGLKGPAAEALQPFAIAHLSGATAGPDAEKAARALGLVVQQGLIGTAEGHAVRDLGTWIANGEFDLAVMAFVNEYRSIDTPAVRYVWSYALLRLVQARKRYFERPVAALETIKLSAPGVQDHLAALAKSIKAAAVCNVCAGAGKLRCTNCHGKKETKFVCTRCKGKGFTTSSLGAELVCGPCKKTGIAAIVKCEKCKDGFFDCKQCDKKPRSAPELDDILSSSPCPSCDGRGLAFRNAAVPCRSCLGLGQKLAPKVDPSKILP